MHKLKMHIYLAPSWLPGAAQKGKSDKGMKAFTCACELKNGKMEFLCLPASFPLLQLATGSISKSGCLYYGMLKGGTIPLIRVSR